VTKCSLESDLDTSDICVLFGALTKDLCEGDEAFCNPDLILPFDWFYSIYKSNNYNSLIERLG